MMGPAHAATGFALGAALTWGLGGDPAHIALGALTVSGTALLPDADHPQGTISRAAGPLTYLATHTISGLTGGHRGALHWVIGILALSALASVPAFSHTRATQVTAWVILTVLFAAALHATRRNRNRPVKLAKDLKVPWRACALVLAMPLAALAVENEPRSLWWMCAAGMLLHDAEDLTTPDGRWLAYHMLWPLSLRLWPGGYPHKPRIGAAPPVRSPSGHGSYLPDPSRDKRRRRAARPPERIRARARSVWDEEDEESYLDDT